MALCPKKKLQKLAYLAEIEYIIKHGERLSDLSFKRYYYGPFSDDIRNVEDLEENIVIIEKKKGNYIVKESELKDKNDQNHFLKGKLQNEIELLIEKYLSKTGKELENIVNNTEPFLETEKLNDPIDLDGYAWFYGQVNSEQFWKNVEKKDEENEANHIYGKSIVKTESDFESLFLKGFRWYAEIILLMYLRSRIA